MSETMSSPLDGRTEYDDDDESFSPRNNPRPSPRTTARKKRCLSPSSQSLESRCRLVVVMNLERYPAEAMGMLDEEAWESIIKHRHSHTTPSSKHNGGGLDGTGRMAPAISHKYIVKVEEVNPHLSESAIADKLVWKDCVEHRFKRGGMLRPTSLNLPWPDLVASIETAKSNLLGFIKDANQDNHVKILAASVKTLTETPMNVALLQQTGVGKAVKQFVKRKQQKRHDEVVHVRAGDESPLSSQEQLQRVLERWITMARNRGVSMNSNSRATPPPPTTTTSAVAKRNGSKDSTQVDDEEDGLKLAQECTTWRQLYTALASREQRVRANQGARMREIRKNLDKGRPKIVKVRPTNYKHDRMLEKKPKTTALHATMSSTKTSKMQQLRAESAVATSWQKSSSKSKMAAIKSSSTRSTFTKPTGFGAAVAFASGDSKTKKRKTSHVVHLGGGKQMKVTKQAIKGTGGFAAAVRKNPSTLNNNNNSNNRKRPPTKTWRK